MKPIKFIIILSALIIAGCKDDIDVSYGYDYDVVDGEYFVIAGEPRLQSRVVYDDNKSVFEDGDRVGMFALTAENTLMPATVENACYYVASIANVNTEKPNRQVLKPVDQEKAVPKNAAKYLVYYPYIDGLTLEQAKNLSHIVKSDQSYIADYEESDLIWDVAIPDQSKNCVNIAFDHAMANFIVKIERELLDPDKGVYLLSSATSAKSIDLTSSDIGSMLYTPGNETLADGIAMCPFGFANNGELIFRAAVPAYQTRFTKDNDIIKIYRADGSEKIYKLATDIELKPGYNYTLTIRKGSNILIIPEAGDEDSWVLEVTDPDDGELVGYLCREYIYWAPAEYATNYRSAPIDDPNYEFKMSEGNLGNTGHSTYMISTNPATEDLIKQLNVDGAPEVTAEGMTQAINSQAWIFYNLKPGTKIPDLTKGSILRFVYDIKGGGGLPGYTPFIHPKYANLPEARDIVMAVWPKPHTSALQSANFQGIFKVKHGHERVNTIALEGGNTGYAYDSPEWLEFYMHGGTITWDPQNNIVDEFFMPEEKITNKIAHDNGHIAIKTENGVKTASISYSAMTSLTEDEDGNNVGQLIVKNLYVNGVAYPLRKVGFNQFWSAKSLHNTADNNGHQLQCFNTDGEVGDVNYDPWSGEAKPASSDKIKFRANQKLPAGYIYPTAKGGDTFESYTYDEDFNPYANEADRAEIAVLYNLTAFTEGKLKPKNTIEESFRFPTWKDMIHLRRYGGVLFAAKWITDHIRTKNADESYLESTTEALREGMLLGNSAFCANISGLDFRAFGMKWPEYNNNGKVSDFGVRNYFFIDAVNDNPFYTGTGDQWDLEADVMNWVEIFRFSPWDCWGSNPISNYRHFGHSINEAQKNRPIAHSRIFAPVRVIMSFNDPIGNGAREAVAAHSRASFMQTQSTRSESRNVYVPLAE